jgi:DNA mismatch endonuclease (patch repair protein)
MGSVTDFLSKETRSRVMARIRSKDTKPELALRRALWAAGVRGWRLHPRTVPGRPDLAFGSRRVAVFVDGRFWHGHPDYFTPGKSGAYWDTKIDRNIARDRKADAELSAIGWHVLRLWDYEVLRDPVGSASRVKAALDAARKTNSSRERAAQPRPRASRRTRASSRPALYS